MHEDAPADANALAKLYAALAAASLEFRPIPKNRSVRIATRQGGAFQFRYADLDAIIAATRPALAKHGLAVIQPVTQTGDTHTIATTLVHAEGGHITTQMAMPALGERDPKEYGATITYLRRYAYTALLCLSADDDIDADGGGGAKAMPVEELATHLQAIEGAPNVAALRAAYAAGQAAAQRYADGDAAQRLTKARDDKLATAGKKREEPADAGA